MAMLADRVYWIRSSRVWMRSSRVWMDEKQPSVDEIQPSVDEIQPSVDEIQPCRWMRSSRVVRASDSQCRSCKCPGFDPNPDTAESEGRQMKQC